MSNLNLGKDLYLKGRIGWKGLAKKEYLKESEYRIINATALNDGYIDWNNCGFITKERYDESPEIMLQENDILISKDGTLGKIGYVKDLPSKCTVSSGIFVLRNTKKDILDTDYLYHILKSDIFKNFIENNKAQGSTINHLYQRDLENFEINLPTLKTQKKSSSVLNAIENEIENNVHINNNLEELMQTLYQRWFIEFEFPNEEGKPYKSSGDKFVYNDELKQEIPEGWNVKKITEIANVYQPEIITIKDIDLNGDYLLYGAGGLMGKYNKFNHEKSAIAISCRGNCGDTFMTQPKSWINGNVMVVAPIEKYNYKEYIFRSLFKEKIMPLITGSVQKQITRTNLSNLKLLIPNKRTLELFEDTVKPYRSKINLVINENQRLTELKNFLLPLLMNGQINVDDIEI